MGGKEFLFFGMSFFPTRHTSVDVVYLVCLFRRYSIMNDTHAHELLCRCDDCLCVGITMSISLSPL